MKIIIVGCGRVGSELALRAAQAGHHVTILDKQSAAFARLAPEFKGRLQEGDALSRRVLKRCGIDEADALIAVTKDDSLNIVVGHIARAASGVARVMVRNHEPSRLPVIEAFGLDVVSCSAWGVDQFMGALVESRQGGEE